MKNQSSGQEPQNRGNIGEKPDRNPDGTFAEGREKTGGKIKGTRNFTTKVKEALEKIAEGKDYSYEEAFIKAILKKAIIDQDSVIIKLIWNYLDGMPIQKIGMGGIDEEGKLTSVVVRVIRTPEDLAKLNAERTNNNESL